MSLQGTNITIVSDQKHRAETLRELVQSALEQPIPIQIVHSDSLQENQNAKHKHLYFIDLMGCYYSSKQLIKFVRDRIKPGRILVLHMYQSDALVKPLFDMGVDGYLYYEPTRSEIHNAVKKVMNDEKYMPLF